MPLMARLRDVPVVFGKIGVVSFAKRVWQQVGEDNIFTWGAALAYSWMFAIFPFLIFLLSLVPLIPQNYKPNVEQDVNDVIDRTLTGDAATAIKNQVHGVLNRQGHGGFLSFGLLITIWAASGGMAMTMTSLDKAYDIEKSRPYLRQRGVAIGLTIAVSILVILVMVLLPVGTAVLTWLSHQKSLGWTIVFVDIARYAIALALMFTILALVYHFGPSFKQKFQAVTPGAIFSVVVWVMLGFFFRLYLTKLGGAASYTKTYGAVAGAAILLLFFYIDALVLLIGAEINSEVDFAVLGLPSGGKPEERAIAPTETATEPEQQELAKELQSRRKPDEVTPTYAPPAKSSAAGGSAGGGGLGTLFGKAIVAVGGVVAAVVLASRMRKQSVKRQIDPRPEPQRLRETYPLTYELINSDISDGKAQTNGDDAPPTT
jgi:membrane protein